MIFWYLYWFQIFKDQCGSVPSIFVAVLGLLDLRGKWILLFQEICQKLIWCAKSFILNLLCLYLGIGILQVAILPRNTGIMRQKPEVKLSSSKNLDSSVKNAIAWSNLGLILKQQKRPCQKSLKGSKNRFTINNQKMTILSGKIKSLNV